jgi:uncharacterized membrane protein YeaQ/YmgE (transglycosylase-associated protein family)
MAVFYRLILRITKASNGSQSYNGEIAELNKGELQMGLLSWIVVGAIAGWLSGKVLKGRGFGLLGDIIVGIAGGLVGGWLAGELFHLPDLVNGINLTSILVAFLGSILLILIARALQGRGRGSLLHR